VGRPREHDDQTAAALLREAERIVEADGVDALTVRRVATAVGTTTRAVYSVYGSKDALVAALGAHGFELLRERIGALPATADPAADLIEAGVTVFRAFAVEHPALYSISVQRALPAPELFDEFRGEAQAALAGLRKRVERLEDAGLLGERSVRDGVVAFHALCEGLASLELRGTLPAGGEERVWRDALTVLVRGFANPSRSGVDSTAPRSSRDDHPPEEEP
jgi:AcrR family transcriptional regulator